MAGMELELSTKKAVDALEAFEKKLASTEGKLKAFDTSGLDKLGTSLAKIKGIDAAVVTSIRDVAKAIGTINKSGNIEAVATSLSSLSKITDLKAAATNVKLFVDALHGLKVPKSMAALAENINKIAEAAGKAAPRVLALSRAMGNVTAPKGLSAAARGIEEIAQAANGSSASVGKFAAALRLLGPAAAVAGLALGAGGLARGMWEVGKAAVGAATDLQQFEAKMGVAKDAGQETAGSLDFVRKTSNKLGMDLQDGMRGFSQLSVSMAEAGNSAEDTRTVYSGFMTGFRAMGLTSTQVARGMNAVNQMFTKGTVSMEELKQQLGELFPAFNMLATSMGTDPLGLAKMINQGKVSSQTLVKLSSDIETKFGPAAAKMAQTVPAAMNRVNNALYELAMTMGQRMEEPLVRGLEALKRVLEMPEVAILAQALGSVLGTAVELVATAVEILAKGLQIVGAVLSEVAKPVKLVANWLTTAGCEAEWFMENLESLKGVVQQIGPILVAAGVFYGGYVVALKAVNTAVDLANTAMGKFMLKTIAIGLAVAGAVATVFLLGSAFAALYESATTDATFLESFQKNLSTLENKAKEVAGSMAKMAGEAIGLVPDINKVSEGSAKASETVGAAADASGDAATGLDKYNKSAAPAADSATKLANGTEKAADKASDLANETGQAADATNKAKGAMNGAVGAANQLTAAYNKAAQAAEKLAQAQSKIKGGGGGGGGSSTVSSMAGGGIAGSMRRTQTVPTSAFINAPALAGGIANTNSLTPSVAGGGIPTILHPNEAVVPLAGGGSIPVSMSGGGGGAELLASINTNIGKLLERFTSWMDTTLRINRQGNITGGGGGVIGSGIGGGGGGGGGGGASSLGGGTQFGMNGSANLSTGGGGGGYSFSLGGGLQGGGPATNGVGSPGNLGTLGPDGKTIFDDKGTIVGQKLKSGRALDLSILDEYQDLSRRYEQLNSDLNSIPSITLAEPGQTTFKPNYSRVDQIRSIRQQMDDIQAQKNRLIARNPILQEYFKSNSKKNNAWAFGGGGARGFATGSPNASKDMMRGGGFNAVLHPNEAVIPLPDGRSVPVSMPKEMVKELTGGGNGNGAGSRVQNITMNITTEDANSFAKSQSQIANEMRARLARAQERSGPPPRLVEDPTRRTTMVK